MAWSTSDRRKRLPPNWASLRADVLRRDDHMCQVLDCGEDANQVDHIEPSGSDEPWNLQSLCQRHHDEKSSAEGNARQAELRKLLKREPEPIPGRIDPSIAVPRKNVGF